MQQWGCCKTNADADRIHSTKFPTIYRIASQPKSTQASRFILFAILHMIQNPDTIQVDQKGMLTNDF